MTHAGRKKFLEILARYVLKQDIVDEWHLWLNTTKQDDIDYIYSLSKEFSHFIKIVEIKNDDAAVHHNDLKNFPYFYNYCIDKSTIYFKFDDDVVFIEDGTFETMIEYKVAHPECFIVFPNIVNNPVMSYLHQRMGAVDTHLGICKLDPWGYNNLYNDAFAEYLHNTFLQRVDEGSLGIYKFDEWKLLDYEKI